MDTSIDILHEILARLKRDVQDLSAELVLLLIPTPSQIEPELDRVRIQRVCQILNLGAEELKLEDELCQRLTRIAINMGVAVVDLRSEFSEIREKTGQPLYYRTDWHCNTTAHEAIATRLLRQLEEMTGS